MGLIKQSHSVTELIYHFTFIPKYRRRRLVGKLKQTLYGMIKFCAQVNDWKILELNIQPDHVHLLMQARSDDSPSSIMQLVKGNVPRLGGEYLGQAFLVRWVLQWNGWNKRFGKGCKIC